MMDDELGVLGFLLSPNCRIGESPVFERFSSAIPNQSVVAFLNILKEWKQFVDAWAQCTCVG